jgi:lysophospholipase L1-like esterase
MVGLRSFVQQRDGVPRMRAKLDRGEPATIVAYGTSMTTNGAYLAALPNALDVFYPRARDVTLTRIGRNGFDTAWAAFDARTVIAERPDLVLLEFSINDCTEDALPLIVPALLGIMGQIRAEVPHCEFVFVYLARAVDILAGADAPIRAHEAFAVVTGIPAIDLASVTAQLVASGRARFDGERPDALTTDGVHHTPFAAQAIGEPFAQALIGMLDASSAPRPLAPLPSFGEAIAAIEGRFGASLADVVMPSFAFDGGPCARSFDKRYNLLAKDSLTRLLVRATTARTNPLAGDIFRRARRASPVDFVASPGWGLGGTTRRVGNLDHREPLLMSTESGALLRFPRCGAFLCLVGFANATSFTVRVDGVETATLAPHTMADAVGQIVLPLCFTDGLTDDAHDIEIRMNGTMMAISDAYYLEAPATA